MNIKRNILLLPALQNRRIKKYKKANILTFGHPLNDFLSYYMQRVGAIHFAKKYAQHLQLKDPTEETPDATIKQTWWHLFFEPVDINFSNSTPIKPIKTLVNPVDSGYFVNYGERAILYENFPLRYVTVRKVIVDYVTQLHKKYFDSKNIFGIFYKPKPVSEKNIEQDMIKQWFNSINRDNMVCYPINAVPEWLDNLPIVDVDMDKEHLLRLVDTKSDMDATSIKHVCQVMVYFIKLLLLSKCLLVFAPSQSLGVFLRYYNANIRLFHIWDKFIYPE